MSASRTVTKRPCTLVTATLLAALTLSPLVGCNAFTRSSVGQARLQSTAADNNNDRPTLNATFDHASYRREDNSTATMVLFDGPPDQPRRAMTVHMFWVPNAGATPIDSTATNATIRYVIFDDDNQSIAIYSGAGFVYPYHRLGRTTMRVRILDTDVHLSDASENDTDPINRGRLTGEFTATHDPDATSNALDQLHELILTPPKPD